MPSKVTCLAFWALAVSSVAAMDIKFMRYSQPSCNGNFHISKDTNLHDPHCKTFDKHEPPFESFMVKPKDKKPNYEDHICTVTVFTEPKCQGDGFTMGDLKFSANECGNVTMNKGARSALVSCKPRHPRKKPSPKSKASKTMKTIKQTIHVYPKTSIVTSTPTKKPTPSPVKPKTTIEMVVTVPYVSFKPITMSSKKVVLQPVTNSIAPCEAPACTL